MSFYSSSSSSSLKKRVPSSRDRDDFMITDNEATLLVGENSPPSWSDTATKRRRGKEKGNASPSPLYGDGTTSEVTYAVIETIQLILLVGLITGAIVGSVCTGIVCAITRGAYGFDVNAGDLSIPETGVDIILGGVDKSNMNGIYQKRSARGQRNGHAELDADGLIPASRIPATAEQASSIGAPGGISPLSPTTGSVPDLNLPLTLQRSSERGKDNGYAPLDANKKLQESFIKQNGGIEYQRFLGTANGYPGLGSDGKIDTIYLPDGLGVAVSSSSVGRHGDMYIVSVSGFSAIDGNSVWSVGEALIFDTHLWIKINVNQTVVSVNGMVCDIVLTLSGINDVGASSSTYSATTETYLVRNDDNTAWIPTNFVRVRVQEYSEEKCMTPTQSKFETES
jgi:hypothetical protein